MGSELPAMTRRMIDISRSAPAALASACIMTVCAFALRRVYGKRRSYQRVTSSIVMKIPLVSGLVRKCQVARFCRLMHLLVSSGVSLLQGLRLMRGIMGFYPYREAIGEMCRGIEDGGTLTDGLVKHEMLYGRKTVVLLRVGEETGSLNRMFINLADDLDADLEHEIAQMNNVMEPALILLIGVVVAFVLIAMYLPMFKLGMTIQ